VAESFVSSPGSSCVAQPGAIERCSVFAPTPNGIAGAGLPVGSGEVGCEKLPNDTQSSGTVSVLK